MQEIRTFEGGLNMDDEERLIAPNEYRYALNIRNSNTHGGANGVIMPVEGSDEVAFSLPGGHNKCIGRIDDEANNRLIYIIYNSTGQNRILAYYYGDQEIRTVFEDQGNTLGLSHSKLITGIDIVVGDIDTYILFVTGEGEPKNINIDAGIRTFDSVYKKFKGTYTLGSGDDATDGDIYSVDVSITNTAGGTTPVTFYYRAVNKTNNDPCTSTDPTPTTDWEFCPYGYIITDVREEYTTNIVKPPLIPPVASYSTNKSQSFNNLYGEAWQFKYKYVYADGRESSWSPIANTDIAPSFADGTIKNNSFIDKSYDNEIILTVDIPHHVEYRGVRVAVRKNTSIQGDFYLFDTLDTQDTSGFIYDSVRDKLTKKIKFTNTEPLIPLDQIESNQLFSWVPRDVKAQAITSENRLLYSNFTEGRSYNANGTTLGRRGFNISPPVVSVEELLNPYDYTVSGIAYGLVREDSAGASVTDGTQATTAETLTAPVKGFDGDKLWINPSSVIAGHPVRVEIPRIFIAQATTSITFAAITISFSIRPTSTNTEAFCDRLVEEINSHPSVNSPVVVSMGGSTASLNFKAVVASKKYDSLLGWYVEIEPQYDSSINVAAIISNRPTLRSSYISRTFKRGSNPKFGIAYSDRYGRLSSVYTNDSMRVDIPWWNHALSTYSNIGATRVIMELGHDAPEWAESYHVVMSKDSKLSYHVAMPFMKSDRKDVASGVTNPIAGKYFFRGWASESDISINASANALSSMGGVELVYIPLDALQGSMASISVQNQSVIGYDFAKGDRVRFCYYMDTASEKPLSAESYFTADYDCEIIGYLDELNCIVIRPSDLPADLSATPGSGVAGLLHKTNETGSANSAIHACLFEIYRPNKTQEDTLYYEVYSGDVIEGTDTAGNKRFFHRSNNKETVFSGVVNPSWVSGERDQTDTQTARLIIDQGNAYLKPRDYVSNFTPSAASAADLFTYFVEDPNLYDRFISNSWGAGRPNRVIRVRSLEETSTGFYGKVTRPTTIRFSEKYNPESNFNGFGTFFDTSYKDTNNSLRSIQLLHTEGDRVFVFHENAVGFMKADQQFIQTLDNQTLAVASGTPLSDVQYYGTRAGIGVSPESFANNNGRKYFVDVDGGQVCRLSGDGITPISSFKMVSFFRDVFKNMQRSKVRPVAWGAYDRRFDEYVVNMKWGQESLFQGQDISFDGGDTVSITVASINLYELYVGQVLSFRVASFTAGSPAVNYNGIQGNCVVTAVNFGTGVVSLRFQESYLLTEAGEFLTQEDGGYIVLGDSDAYDIVQLADEFYLTLERLSCASFNENINKWTSHFNFFSEAIGGAGLDFFSWVAGKLMRHSDYTSRAVFGSDTKEVFIDVVSNASPQMVKIWKNIAIKADTDWVEFNTDTYVARVPSVTTLTSTSQEMTAGVLTSTGKWHTVIPPSFKYREQQLVGAYSGEKNNLDSTFTGREKVRGYWQKTRIQIANKTHKIFAAVFEVILSNYTR